jgi:hypothetical protein
MDALYGIFTWLSDQEATISAVVGITVVADLRSLVRSWTEASQEKVQTAAAEPAPAAETSPPDLDLLTVPGYRGPPGPCGASL